MENIEWEYVVNAGHGLHNRQASVSGAQVAESDRGSR
jgi:hypothetical protein